MIAEAKKNAPKARFYTDWDSIDADFEHSLLNISSVLLRSDWIEKKQLIEP